VRHPGELGRDQRWREQLAQLERQGLRRRLRQVGSAQDVEIVLDGRRVVNFSGNSSLGLANHPEVTAAALQAVETWGVGAGASRLISGSMAPHHELEAVAAQIMQSQRALLFASGYQANIGVIPVLAGRDAVILSDELNHASLIDGIRLSRAECRVFRHNDVHHLDELLASIPGDREVVVVTEALFSMEADRAPLQGIVELKQRRPFVLYLDEAHSFGTLGPQGGGLALELGCAEQVDCRLGTLGKAAGVAGAVVAGSEALIELLISRARSFIFATAPMPVLAAAASTALQLIGRGEQLRQRLHDNVALFRQRTTEILGVSSGGQDHIVPVLCPGADRVMEASAALLERGLFCQGIRPPTVPPGTCRLRLSISAQHTAEHLERAARILGEVLGRK